MKTLQEIEIFIIRIQDANIEVPDNTSLMIELNNKDFLDLQQEVHGNLLTTPDTWKVKEFTLSLSYGLKVRVKRIKNGV